MGVRQHNTAPTFPKPLVMIIINQTRLFQLFLDIQASSATQMPHAKLSLPFISCMSEVHSQCGTMGLPLTKALVDTQSPVGWVVMHLVLALCR